jgi:carbamoyltransferase
VNENLNHYVKHREKYRPFAAAVPAERAGEYFEFTDSALFVTSLARVKDAHRELFASNLLMSRETAAPENRIRVQVVDRGTNRAFWELLNAFGADAGVPVLYNTSFNLFGEPLVNSPRDAVRSFYCSGLDHLMIGPFSLAK